VTKRGRKGRQKRTKSDEKGGKGRQKRTKSDEKREKRRQKRTKSDEKREKEASGQKKKRPLGRVLLPPPPRICLPGTLLPYTTLYHPGYTVLTPRLYMPHCCTDGVYRGYRAKPRCYRPDS